MNLLSKTNLTTAAFLSLLSFNAHSLVIGLDTTTSATEQINNFPINGSIDHATAPNNASSLVYNSDILGPVASGLGNGDGSFGTAASSGAINGSWVSTFSLAGQVSQLYTITNNQANDQKINFDFQITAVGLSIECLDLTSTPASCFNNVNALAGYNARIIVNGSTIWSSAAEIALDATNGTSKYSTSGVELGKLQSSPKSFIMQNLSKQNFTLDLGTLAAGDSLKLQYVTNVYAKGKVKPSTKFFVVGSEFGDPNGFGAASNTGYFTSPSAVPEPMTLGLFASGLFSLGFFNRKRIKKI